LLLRHVRRYANIQGDIAYNQGFEDDPYTLWLDFESGISPTPKNFFNPRPIVLARDKKKMVSDLENHPLRLAAELEVVHLRAVDPSSIPLIPCL
jgi:hypothetical protein